MRLTLAIIILLCLSCAAFAQGTQIQADTTTRTGNTYFLKGNVQIERDGSVFNSDEATYNDETGELEGEGNVTLKTDEYFVKAERGFYNQLTSKGLLYGAKITLNAKPHILEGQEMRIESPRRFFLKDGKFTTCKGLRPSWCIKSKNSDILLGERIKTYNATFNTKDIPVMYTPYFYVPIVAERRSGFLSPSFGYSKTTGFFFRQPWYWAMSVNRDATFTVDMFSNEALGQSVQYRYVESPYSKGAININHLRDSSSALDYYEIEAHHRTRTTYDDMWIDIKHLNREDYYQIYEPYLEDSSRRYLASNAEFSSVVPEDKFLSYTRLYINTQQLQDLKPGVSKDRVLQPKPAIGVDLSPQTLGPIVLSGNAGAARFDRKLGSKGNRLLAKGKASHSMGTAVVLAQSVSNEVRTYDTSGTASGTADVSMSSYKGSVGLTLTRKYDNLRHSISPTLTYDNVNVMGDAFPMLFDENEYLADTSRATLSVMSRLSGAQGEFLTDRITQAYNFNNDTKPYEHLVWEFSVRNPRKAESLSGVITYDHYSRQVQYANSNINYSGKHFTIGISTLYLRPSNLNVYSINGTVKVNDNLDLLGGVRYDNIEERDAEEVIMGFNYRAQCWNTGLTYVKKPDDYTIFLRIALLGVGDLEIK